MRNPAFGRSQERKPWPRAGLRGQGLTALILEREDRRNELERRLASPDVADAGPGGERPRLGSPSLGAEGCRDSAPPRIIDAPDNVSVSAVSLAVAAAGGFRGHTTVLLTPEETDEAVKKAVKYRAPGQ